jgi:hypothetical protein
MKKTILAALPAAAVVAFAPQANAGSQPSLPDKISLHAEANGNSKPNCDGKALKDGSWTIKVASDAASAPLPSIQATATQDIPTGYITTTIYLGDYAGYNRGAIKTLKKETEKEVKDAFMRSGVQCLLHGGHWPKEPKFNITYVMDKAADPQP